MHVSILGITGGVGSRVAEAFLAAGHTVTALARDPSRVAPAAGLTLLKGDANNPADLDRAVAGADAVFHGLNLPYQHWDPGMVDLTAKVLAAAERADATLLFPSNLYGLGPDFSAPLTEQGRYEPISRKGALRNRLEAMLQASSAPTILLRAGDFFGGPGASAWVHHLTVSARTGGALQYPANPDTLHSWAYLPDVAATFVRLAERRAELPPHAVFHFEGHIVDGHTFTRAARAALGDPDRRVKAFPWLWMQLARPFVPMVRELFEMRYLWDQPVRMDGSKLRAFLGDVPHTPFEEALAAYLQDERAVAA